jgi:hypothetical protein
MNARLRGTFLVWAVPVLVGGIAAIVGSYYLPETIAEQASRRAPRHPRTHRSTTAAAMPALPKMDLQRAAAGVNLPK